MFGYIHRKDIFMKEKFIKLIIPVLFTFMCTVCTISLWGCGGRTQVVTQGESTLRQTESKPYGGDISETYIDGADRTCEVYVYVAGRVKNPNVYRVPEDYRIYQVIELAGGFLEDAETRNINLADKIFDGMQITVYAVGEETVQTYGESVSDSSMVNINTASKEELMTLPGIGEAKAESIISYRNKNGYFSSIEDIMKISGIKEGAFEKIKGYITV